MKSAEVHNTERTEPAVLVAGVRIGPGEAIRIIAGPCSVEGPEQFRDTAEAVKRGGAVLLRGGAFKPRTSPYAFQGLGQRGLEIMREVADELGMGVVTEAIATDDVPLVAGLADMVQSEPGTWTTDRSFRLPRSRGYRSCSSGE